ncbi:hypothetical protein GRF29_77g505881 [Pseudopithomyces chartarum]|uniref:Uncharacterized protein n=1 Tax=Pseudopithomyces chartarum TaxID=1892770 RepID=A0AAN6LZT6_9PLEO|nr:hypothetical protein GRF29_77g505881 [Pseudopithomyces chartarum]
MTNVHQASDSEIMLVVDQTLLTRAHIIQWRDLLQDIQSNMSSSLSLIDDHDLCKVAIDNLEVMASEDPKVADLIVVEAKKRFVRQHLGLKDLWSTRSQSENINIPTGALNLGSLWRTLYDDMNDPRLWKYQKRDILVHDDRGFFQHFAGAYVAILLLVKELLNRLDAVLNDSNLTDGWTKSQHTQELNNTHVEHLERLLMSQDYGASTEQNGDGEAAGQSQSSGKSLMDRIKWILKLVRTRDTKRDDRP